MLKSLLTAAALALPAVGMAQLQLQAPPTGFSGALVKFSEESVTLKDKEGKELVVAMTPGWTVSRPKVVTATDVKAGQFIASANKVVNDSTGESTELRIMEPGYRPEEGTHLMNAQTNTAMTHGTITTIQRSDAALELEVIYSGGARQLIVPAAVKITDYVLLDRKILMPGMAVSAVARKGTDGVLRAGRLTLPAQ